MKRLTITFLLAVSIVISAFTSYAQATKNFSVKASAELVSSYIWRGSPCFTTNNNGSPSLAPNIQPTLGFVMGGLEVGAWGSSDFSGNYKEMDLYASYTYKTITATFTDYYLDPAWASKPYFLYKKETTGHMFEGSLCYKGTNVPLCVMVSTMFYGADKKATDATMNNYSTYIELGYTFKVNDYSFDSFLGMTPSDGMYGDGYGNVTGFGVVNLGLTGYKKIQLSEKYQTTLRSTIIFNPQQDKAYLVLGISL